MDQELYQKLEKWHQDDEFQKIIDTIEAIPAGARGYELTGLLARAYANIGREGETEPFEKAVALLNSIKEEGRADPNWHFRMGYALFWLGRKEEAIPYFERVLELIPDDPQSQEFWSDCRAMLDTCRSEVQSREITARYKADPLNPEKAQEYLLYGVLHGSMPVKDTVEGDRLLCPEWKMEITPQIEGLTERSAVVNFWLSAPQWGQRLFECSVGMGAGTDQAIGMAAGSFLFSFMQGIAQMESGQEPHETAETSFAGHTHRWKVYLSDIVGMGEQPARDPSHYWGLLREGILKRLGNQKLCYVKVYAAKSYGEVTGECRVNDIKSEELSKLVEQEASSWETEKFASHKMFFFLRQEEETVQPYPYWGEEGRARIKRAVMTAAKLLHNCETQEQYERLPERLRQELGDVTLAEECYSFLPEICAENAFDQISYSETVNIRDTAVWKNQLADYWTLHDVLFELFDEGAFGDAANEIYQEYISVSAIYGVVRQIWEKKENLEDISLTALVFQPGDGFELR